MKNEANPLKNLNVPIMKLIYRSNLDINLCPKIASSRDAYDVLRAQWDSDTIELYEEFKILVLNRAHRVMGIIPISIGGVSGTVADPKLIWSAALLTKASGIICAHNHPSSALTPSQADIDLTKKLKTGGQALEIQLLDHVILTKDKYYSFADEGLL